MHVTFRRRERCDGCDIGTIAGIGRVGQAIIGIFADLVEQSGNDTCFSRRFRKNVSGLTRCLATTSPHFPARAWRRASAITRASASAKLRASVARLKTSRGKLSWNFVASVRQNDVSDAFAGDLKTRARSKRLHNASSRFFARFDVAIIRPNGLECSNSCIKAMTMRSSSPTSSGLPRRLPNASSSSHLRHAFLRVAAPDHCSSLMQLCSHLATCSKGLLDDLTQLLEYKFRICIIFKCCSDAFNSSPAPVKNVGLSLHTCNPL